jgi:hypothetical protein
MKRIGAIFAATSAELAGVYASKRFASRALVLNTDSGELRQGPGFWADMKPFTAGSATEVVAATTGNITINTGLNAGDTIDGVTLAAGDLVLVKNQSTAHQNGVYVVGASPARAAAFDTFAEHVGKMVRALGGTVNKNAFFRCNVEPGGTLNTTAIGWDGTPTNLLNLAGLNQLADLPVLQGADVDGTELVAVQKANGQMVSISLTELKTYMSA